MPIFLLLVNNLTWPEFKSFYCIIPNEIFAIPEVTTCWTVHLIAFSHYFQGYDDIPKEIPDPDAKKVLICGYYVVCVNRMYSKMCIAAWGLGWWGRWWMDCPYHSKPRIQGTMEAKGMTVPLTAHKLTAIYILISDSMLLHLPENQEPELPG